MANTVRLHGFIAVLFSQILTLSILYGVEAGYNYMVPKEANYCKGNGEHSLQSEAYLENIINTLQIPNTATDMTCAMASSRRKADAFSYEDGSCTIFGNGEGQDATESSVAFRPYTLESVSLEEVTRNKTTYASDSQQIRSYFLKELALDGSIIFQSGVNEGYLSALGITNPWWIVDIGEIAKIHQIHIYPRQRIAYRFYNIEVRVGSSLKTDGDLSSYTLVCTYDGPYDSAEGLLICTRFEAISGRYISIQKSHDPSIADELLQITEVNVFAERP